MTCDTALLGDPCKDLAVMKLAEVPSDLKAMALSEANVIKGGRAGRLTDLPGREP